jgi:hypothetical protein
MLSVVEPIKNMWCEVEGFLEGCVILGISFTPTKGLATWGEIRAGEGPLGGQYRHQLRALGPENMMIRTA